MDHPRGQGCTVNIIGPPSERTAGREIDSAGSVQPVKKNFTPPPDTPTKETRHVRKRVTTVIFR
jgi:hypothetical protein